MKAFVAAVVALAVISVAADVILGNAGFSAEEVYAGQNVRLDN